MINNNLRFFNVMLCTSLIISSYQLPLIENTLNKYGYENNINEKFTFSKNFQQFLENQKISFSSFVEDNNFNTKEKNSITVSNDLKVKAINDGSFKPHLNNTITNNMQAVKISTAPIIDNTVDINQLNIQSKLNTEPPIKKSLLNQQKTCIDNCIVLMIGDSVMGDIDFSMQRLIKKDFPTWKIIDAHKVSSGLTNQTYYDWPLTAKKLVEKYNPDYTFILLGTNDAQGMMHNGKGLAFSKELWLTEYSNRVNQITTITESNNSQWFWIELPVTKDKSFNSRLQFIRNIQFEQTKEHYISVESIFGKNDYSKPIDLKLRANDGIHLNSSGADLVAKELINKLKGL